jgi:hypothetical protein
MPCTCPGRHVTLCLVAAARLTHSADEMREVDVRFAAGAYQHVLGVVGHAHNLVRHDLEGGGGIISEAAVVAMQGRA